MKQTIEIEVPDGKKAVWKDGKVVFEDIKPQLPKTWEEYCDKHGEVGDKIKASLNTAYTIINKHIFSDYKQVQAHIACVKLHLLRDEYRQGWRPTWTDKSTKYGVVWNTLSEKKKLIVAWHSYAPLFLSFPTEEIAREFLSNFRDLIEEAGDLI